MKIKKGDLVKCVDGAAHVHHVYELAGFVEVKKPMELGLRRIEFRLLTLAPTIDGSKVWVEASNPDKINMQDRIEELERNLVACTVAVTRWSGTHGKIDKEYTPDNAVAIISESLAVVSKSLEIVKKNLGVIP